MKKDIHPKGYRLVVFKDMSNEYTFMTRSTVQTKTRSFGKTAKNTPLVKLEISHTSHRFYTGKMKFVDTPAVLINSGQSTRSISAKKKNRTKNNCFRLKKREKSCTMAGFFCARTI